MSPALAATRRRVAASVCWYGRARVAARRTGHNEDVCRLDVAVHDAGVVGLIERLEDIHCQPSNIGRAEPLRTRQERLERHPLHELHHKEGRALASDTKVYHPHCLRALQPAQQHGLVAELPNDLCLARMLAAQHLDGVVKVRKLHVAGLEHIGKAALA
jgi:hypothetical protein